MDVERRMVDRLRAAGDPTWRAQSAKLAERHREGLFAWVDGMALVERELLEATIKWSLRRNWAFSAGWSAQRCTFPAPTGLLRIVDGPLRSTETAAWMEEVVEDLDEKAPYGKRGVFASRTRMSISSRDALTAFDRCNERLQVWMAKPKRIEKRETFDYRAVATQSQVVDVIVNIPMREFTIEEARLLCREPETEINKFESYVPSPPEVLVVGGTCFKCRQQGGNVMSRGDGNKLCWSCFNGR